MTYLQRAGQQAAQHSAYTEAISHLHVALELLNKLPDTPERLQHELTIQTTLGPALIAVRGQAAPEVQGALRSMRCQNSRSFCIRWERWLPAIKAALIAPIDVPIIQSGSMPDSCSASYTPAW